MAVQKKQQGEVLGILLNFATKNTTGFVPELVTAHLDGQGSLVLRTYYLADRNSLAIIRLLPHHLRLILEPLALEEQARHAGIGHGGKPQPGMLQQVTQQQALTLNRLYYKIIRQLQPHLYRELEVFLAWERNGTLKQQYRKARLSSYSPLLKFKLTKTTLGALLEIYIQINHELYPLADFERKQSFLKDRGELFMLKPDDAILLDELEQIPLKVAAKQVKRFLKEVVAPLRDRYDVDETEFAETEVIDTEPENLVHLSELGGDFLVIRPAWRYDWYETDDLSPQGELTVQKENTLYRIVRNAEYENRFREQLRAMHPDFERQTKDYFYLKTADALKKGWFYNFYNQLMAAGTAVTGAERLKQFKYSPHAAEVTLTATGAIDWFDVTVEVKFGEYIVPLTDLRSALLNHQQYVLLKDGSLGILPVGFEEQYGLLLKMGQVEKNRLKLTKYHWQLLDEMTAVKKDAVLEQDFASKKALLRQADFSKTYPLPANIRATLRNYQVAGYQWLRLLHALNWGACLADDMGLGKTLQTICFLQYLAQQKPKQTHLVVCPTSLIFNWQAELEKFAPALRYMCYYGSDRELDSKKLKQHDIIITSYGCMRSDIDALKNIKFGYVVLDESHAIKNPASQAARAAMELCCHNRIALSGTPVQNNTFDLYAQMQFINPGLLGSRDFFKTQFAHPIDKLGDTAAAAGLQKIVYPFILRRTKEQVAKDLPDKTETIIWCEMEAEQRKIYESFKDHYRNRLLGQIDELGMGKSSVAILEGLMRLRQVCNSPAIINDGAGYPDVSIKKEELVREIEDNIGHHKALVFSQFTSMLQLVKTALEEKEIELLYLDGSTPAALRQQLVQRFQEDAGIRVFLISLQAGGVGLNLTAADYVYLIDPWWNPAAEAQAIDRTHRIGQTQKVFAYKMICRGTVEEKILHLQQKKKMLSNALVAEETGFVKKLSRQDVEFLFS